MKAKATARVVAWDLVFLEAVAPLAWPKIGKIVAEVVQQECGGIPRVEDTLP